MSNLVISLDFELFWGVADSRTIAGYGKNIEGVWDVVPRILALFRQYDVRVTWATVGMLMCRDYTQWREICPSLLPTYSRQQCSTYALDATAREYPHLFFARPLVEQVLETPGQELATHTYSHFYCGEEGVTPEQFTADLVCAQHIASDMNVQHRALVFPRNQIRKEFIAQLAGAKISAYRGNSKHWLYRDGHFVPGGLAGRVVRFADAWMPLSGSNTVFAEVTDSLTNVSASLFLRPWSARLATFESIRLSRLKRAMTAAALSGGICHLWWHPHNFGTNLLQNLKVLESLLRHYRTLRDQYGMTSSCIGDFCNKGKGDI